MSNEIDELMSRDPLELNKDPEALDKIIKYHRDLRAAREAGPKTTKRGGSTAASPALSLESLNLKRAETPITRRKLAED